MEAIRKVEPETPTSVPAVPSDGELIDYLALLWRWKFWIGLGTLGAAGVALAVSLTRPTIYQATAMLMVTRSKVGPDQQPSAYSVALVAKTFEGITTSHGAMEDAVAKFKLDQPPFSFTPRDLLSRVDSSAVRDSNLLTLSVEFQDPRLAADIANFLAQRAVDFNTTLNKGEIGESRSVLESQVAQAAASVTEAERALEDYEKTAEVDIVRKKAEIALGRSGDLEAQRTRVEADLAAAAGTLTNLEQELAAQPETLTAQRTLNPLRSFVEQKMVEARGEIRGLTARKAHVEQAIGENATAVAAAQADLTERGAQLRRLTRAYDLQRGSYATLRGRLDAANIDVVSRTYLLKVVDPAVPAQLIVRPRLLVNTAIGALAGWLCMVAAALVSGAKPRAGSRAAP